MMEIRDYSKMLSKFMLKLLLVDTAVLLIALLCFYLNEEKMGLALGFIGGGFGLSIGFIMLKMVSLYKKAIK